MDTQVCKVCHDDKISNCSKKTKQKQIQYIFLPPANAVYDMNRNPSTYTHQKNLNFLRFE